MRVSISNIAWDRWNDEAVVSILQKNGIDAIDVAPTKYFEDVRAISSTDVRKVREWWQLRGIAIIGMQSLMFGQNGLNVFDGPASRKEILVHLRHICGIAEGLGASRLVFGSPKNRNRLSLDDQTVEEVSTEFFRELGDIAAEHGVIFCLEPNPSVYGANFMVDSFETAKVVSRIDHPAICMQLDIGASTINQEPPEAVLRACASLVGHVHFSEPGLVEVGRGSANHREWAAVMRDYGITLGTIEMVGSTEIGLAAIERSVRFARATYGDFEVPGSSS